MEIYRSLFIVLAPWLIFLVLALTAKFLIKSARKRGATAVAFGSVSQMVLPDPNVEKTIEIVMKAKRMENEEEVNEDNKPKRHT